MSGPNKNRRLKIKTLISEVKGISFGMLLDEDVRKLSVKRIDQAVSFDALTKPVSGGFYDPALGVLKNTEMYGILINAILSFLITRVFQLPYLWPQR